MVVFYGSQTGTAEEFATRLCKEARYYGISAMSADPIEYDVVSTNLGLLFFSFYYLLVHVSLKLESWIFHSVVNLHFLLSAESCKLIGQFQSL